jgi:hypothetical protein
MQQKPDAQQDYTRRIVMFAILEGAFILLVFLPVLLYLFVFDNGLGDAQRLSYVIQLLLLQVVVSGLLLWKLRIIPGPRTDR